MSHGGNVWPVGLAGRLGHWAGAGLIVSILAAIAIGVWPPRAGSYVSLLMPLAVFALIIASWIAMRQHDRSLCEVCVIAMPLNAAEVAAKYHARFSLAHASMNRPLVAAYLIVLIGSNIVRAEGAPGRIAWAIVQSTMIYLILAHSSHRRFQPWCPRCSEGGGGEDRVDAPEPMPQGGRTN